MHLIVRFFPEIIIKSPPVRKKLIRQLHQNVDKVLQQVDRGIEIKRDWEKLEIFIPGDRENIESGVIREMQRIPGIDNFSKVVSRQFTTLEEIAEFAKQCCAELLQGKSFVVRAKRHGQHAFGSDAVEREVGGYLLHNTDARSVDLHQPDITVRLDIKHDRVFVLHRNWKGIGGYPLGSQEATLSLLSGGFDSSVASYLSIRRGLITHYLFFNLGGRAHEISVREMAFHLWSRFGRSHSVKFVSVPFEQVVNQIIRDTPTSYNAVLLKRMMLRAASKLAENLKLPALVTGESVAQVSSQTLSNLAAIDEVASTLVLRPLATSSKREIIDIAREIGTEAAAAATPEYCGVVSSNPTTRARPEKIREAEESFDFSVLDAAIAGASVTRIEGIMEGVDDIPVDIVAEPFAGSVVIDVRHPDEVEQEVLHTSVPVEVIPYFELSSKFANLDAKTSYLLYCKHGVMSRLQAEMLIEAGFRNVGVYRPDH